MKKPAVVVIGGGLAGTAAAHTLVRHGYTVTIVEKSDYLGGRIHSQTTDGVTVEMGATFLTTVYSNIFRFLDEKSLRGQLQKRKSSLAIVRNGKPYWLSSPTTFLGEAVLTHSAKLRLAQEALIVLAKWRKLGVHDLSALSNLDTQTVEDYLSTPAGKALKEAFIQPCLAGYCYWEPERTSRAMIPWMLRAGAASSSRFVLQGGLRQIPEAAAVGAQVLLSHEATRVERTNNGGYKIIVTNGKATRILAADGVVCATTATVVPAIIPGLNANQRAFFSSFQYSSTAVTMQRFQRDKPVPAHGIAYPGIERKHITAVASETSINTHGTPIEIIKIYASNRTAKQLLKQPDQLVKIMLTDAAGTPGKSFIKGQTPDCVQLWPEALPEFNQGHFKKLRELQNGGIEDGALVFAGDYLGGPFMEGAFTSGVRAAERLVARFIWCP